MNLGDKKKEGAEVDTRAQGGATSTDVDTAGETAGAAAVADTNTQLQVRAPLLPCVSERGG